VVAWVLTLPGAAIIGGAAYGLTTIFGNDALGVVLVTLMVISLVAAAFGSRLRRGPALTAAAEA
jgi:PiT family inorganic phosphate transporter